MLIGSPYHLINTIGEERVLFGNKQVPAAHSLESLGIQIDENLSWEKRITKKASAVIEATRRAKPYVNINTLQTICKALVQPHFDYCSTL